jgi:hypothetical protein
MLNYLIERALLEPLVPRGLALDEFGSITYVSPARFRLIAEASAVRVQRGSPHS